jgi:prepilin-type N-terminal cleavage/methylation domain-containing protein
MVNMKHSQDGFTLLEIIVSSAIIAAVGAWCFSLITQQQRGVAAEHNRLNAKIAARAAVQNIKQLFRQAGGVMNISPGSIALGSDAFADNYAVVENTCVAPPVGATVEVPPFSSVPGCPDMCAAGAVPRIKVTYKALKVELLPEVAGEAREIKKTYVAGAGKVDRFFPTSFDGLYGAFFCAHEYPVLKTFPASLRVPNYSVMVYVGWKTFRSGTSAGALWVVDGAFLAGGEAQNVVLKDHE